jgi:hypothetical protein
MASSRTLTAAATPLWPGWWRALRPLARVLAGLRTFRGGPRRLDPLELSEHWRRDLGLADHHGLEVRREGLLDRSRYGRAR